MPRVIKRNVENLSSEDYYKCKSLNYRSRGEMLQVLIHARQYPKTYPGRAYLIKDKGDKLLSWALVTQGKVNFYTRKSHRRKGYGKQISQHIAKEYDIENLEVGMYDERSEAFFAGTKYNKRWR